MITRRYENAEGQQQEVTLSADAWEALTEDGLNEMLGFNKPKPVAEEKPAKPAKAFKAKAK